MVLILVRLGLEITLWRQSQCFISLKYQGAFSHFPRILESLQSRVLPVTIAVSVCSVTSSPTLCDLWIVIRHALLPIRFSRQEYWSGLLCPPPRDLPEPEIKLISRASPVLQSGSLPTEPPWKSHHSRAKEKSQQITP